MYPRAICVAFRAIGTPAPLSRRSSKKEPHSSRMTHLPPHLRSVADYTKSLRKLFEQALARRLRKGVSDGDLPPGTNVKELAAYFDTIFRGMAVQARDGASRKQLLAICQVAMRAWPSRPPDSNHKTDHKDRPRGVIS